MSKLLRSNLSRMFRDKVFLLCVIGMIAIGIYFPSNQLFRDDGVMIEYGSIVMGYPLFLGALCSVFCSMFVGCEYSDGTIRNKIVVGHTRTEIYFTNLITQFIALALTSLSYIIAVTVVGLPILAEYSTFDFLKAVPMYLGCALLLMLAYASLHTMLSMTITNKAVASIVSLLLFIVMLITAFCIFNMLEAPEYYPGYSITNPETGEMQQAMIKNEQYLTGAKRTRYEFYFDFLPTGQAFQLAWLAAERLARLPLYSIILTVVTTGIGWTIFGKKDLK